MGALDRIAADPAIVGGKPIVRGVRSLVELILSLLAQGETQKAILDDYPGLDPRTSGPALPMRMPSSPMIGGKTLWSRQVESPDRSLCWPRAG
jgi:hypothetical protein